ncbi:Tfp pilus assembly protein FimV [Microbacterium resistens]|uniref:Tfp pilus assembly protein FimV n=1 Tax=Microbacterium resistens TaxID=156977 RepID=A0ABU1S747_9MICO|nr:LysM peptidoglycan-binding domain-containing protein [Microbacterium resistens]MDR6865445.1 Tfp pilus assembly protein FimV [Microbacterium resistens]
MSSITITPVVPTSIARQRRAVTAARGPQKGAEPTSTRLRITARGRRVLAAFAALPIAGAIAFAVLSGGSALASGSQTTGGAFETVTVMPGDTLWSIAAEVAPDADPRDVVSAIARLNLIERGSLDIGQQISIPAEYASAK